MSNEEYLQARVHALNKEVKKKDNELNDFKKSLKMHLGNFPAITFMDEETVNYIEKLRGICDEPSFEEQP